MYFNARLASPLHVHSTFCRIFKDLLEKCLFVLKTEENLYILRNVWGTLCLSAVQQGCNWNFLSSSSVSRFVMLLLFCYTKT